MGSCTSKTTVTSLDEELFELRLRHAQLTHEIIQYADLGMREKTSELSKQRGLVLSKIRELESKQCILLSHT